MKTIRWSAHALQKVAAREVDALEVERTVAAPQIVNPARPPRLIFMRRYLDSVLQTEMLLRVVVEESEAEIVIVTVYKTSKFDKYEWQNES